MNKFCNLGAGDNYQCKKKKKSNFSTKTYHVDTQKDHLMINEMVLLSTQNIWLY